MKRIEVSVVDIRVAADDLWDVLDDEERRRAERFRFEDDRLRSIVARGTLRRLLGQRLGRDPRELAFVTGPHGKPALRGGELEFNVSHSGDRVAVAIAAAGAPIGIDIEREAPRATDLVTLARRYFSPDEAGAVERAGAGEALGVFFSIWTAKEAVIKAVGGGLSISLSSFSVLPLSERLQPVLQMEGWQVCSLRSGDSYRAALSVRGSGWDIVIV